MELCVFLLSQVMTEPATSDRRDEAGTIKILHSKGQTDNKKPDGTKDQTHKRLEGKT